jgi:predicted aldo/keto reductase-like oxidoreductase
MDRRTFIGGMTVPLVAARRQAGSPAARPAEKILNQQEGMQYRRLPAAGISVSQISLGGMAMQDAVHHYAIEHGVNLVHMASSYIGGRAIYMLGEVLKTKRDKVYLALKDDYRSLDEALKILNTDHVDFLMFNRHDPESARDPRIPEIFENFRKQGKARFAGLTVHGNVKATVAAGIQSGYYSFIMATLNQPNLEAIGEELNLAREKGIGIMAIKTMRGLRGLDLETAYLKKVLRNPAVTTLARGIASFEMFDAYLKASNEPLTAREDRMLYRYAQANRANNCMMCDECRQACPRGIAISTVLRAKDYYRDQLDDLPAALAAYREIPAGRRWAPECAGCRRCEAVCPNGIGIVARLEAARECLA